MKPRQKRVRREMDRLGSTDSDLVRRARQGDEAAYHEMVDRYGPYLYRLALSLVGNAADAEDVLQETFSGAFERLRGFEQRASVKTWLSRILFRQAARCHRHRRRHKTVSLDSMAETPKGLLTSKGSGSAESKSDARMDVLAALGALSAIHREVIVLRELHGMTYAEIADVLGVPPGTVESRLFRARQALRERLQDYLR